LKRIFLAASLVLLIIASVVTLKNYTSKSAINQQDYNSTISEKKIVPTSKETIPSQINPQTVKIKAEDFILKDLRGNDVSLSSLKGKNIMLNFFATWCPPCKTEMPDMEKLYQETKDTDLIILAVNLGEDINTIKAFMDKNKYNFRVLLDLKGDIATTYNVSAIPTTYFINKEGNIVSFEDMTTGKTVNRKQGAMTYEEMKKYVNFSK
jgi:peroxiredoxin